VASDEPHARKYRETFHYRTELDRAEEARAGVAEAARHRDLDLVSIDVRPSRRGKATLEITVVGSSESITSLRESLKQISFFSNAPGFGNPLNDVIGEVLDATATGARRGVWAAQRHRRGPEETSPPAD